jgi:type I restriction enzyme S subunit
MFGDTSEARYPVEPLDDVADTIDYGFTASATEEAIGPKFLRITDIQDGKVDWGAVPYCEATQSDISAKRLLAGDIVFARTGATTGKSFLIKTCPTDSIFASYLIRVRPSKKLLPEFVSSFFQTPDYWRQISLQANGAAQPGVNSKKLKELLLPVPPLGEQEKFRELYNSVCNNRGLLEDDLVNRNALFSALQHRAFRGEL